MTPFGASLRWYREQARLTQIQLAVRSGISASTIIRYETARFQVPQERTLRRLADALGVPAGRLLEPPPLPLNGAAEASPVPPAAVPCDPPAPVAGQGTPALMVDHATGAGPEAPGAAADLTPHAAPGSTPDALSGEEWRKAAKAELSAQHAAQRRGRVRRKPPGITGVVRLPPEGDSA